MKIRCDCAKTGHVSSRTVVGLILVSLIATSGAHADDGSSDIFRAFTLEGVWSPDCYRSPSEDNPRVVWRVARADPLFMP